MDYSLIKASERLSELNRKIVQDGYAIDVYWFRVMFKEGEWFIKRHAHSTLEFHFIARGNCMVSVAERRFKAEQGTFFLTAPGVPHEQQPGDSSELVEYSLNCDIRRIGTPADMVGGEMEWLHSVFLNTPCSPVVDAFGAFPLFEAALREADRGLPGFEVTVRNLVVMILVAAARAMKVPALPERAEEPPRDREDLRVAHLERFVMDNIQREVTPSELSAVLNVSERQLCRVVTQSKGYSTKKFITRTKLKKAKQLLCDTNMALKEIAEALGFSNEYYFNSVFKKHEGYPPGVFRKSMRERPDAPP